MLMKLVLQSKNIEITDAIRDYVNQKIERAVSHFENITTGIDVNLSQFLKNINIIYKQQSRTVGSIHQQWHHVLNLRRWNGRHRYKHCSGGVLQGWNTA